MKRRTAKMLLMTGCAVALCMGSARESEAGLCWLFGHRSNCCPQTCYRPCAPCCPTSPCGGPGCSGGGCSTGGCATGGFSNGGHSNGGWGATAPVEPNLVEPNFAQPQPEGIDQFQPEGINQFQPPTASGGAVPDPMPRTFADPGNTNPVPTPDANFGPSLRRDDMLTGPTAFRALPFMRPAPRTARRTAARPGFWGFRPSMKSPVAQRPATRRSVARQNGFFGTARRAESNANWNATTRRGQLVQY